MFHSTRHASITRRASSTPSNPTRAAPGVRPGNGRGTIPRRHYPSACPRRKLESRRVATRRGVQRLRTPGRCRSPSAPGPRSSVAATPGSPPLAPPSRRSRRRDRRGRCAGRESAARRDPAFGVGTPRSLTAALRGPPREAVMNVYPNPTRGWQRPSPRQAAGPGAGSNGARRVTRTGVVTPACGRFQIGRQCRRRGSKQASNRNKRVG